MKQQKQRIQYATKGDVKTLGGQIKDLAKDMSLVLRAVNNGFTNMEARFSDVTYRLGGVEKGVDSLNHRVGSIEIAFRQDQDRLGVIEKHIGIDRL